MAFIIVKRLAAHYDSFPVDSGVGALTAEHLTPLAEAAVAALLQKGDSLNTQASYRNALRCWAAWFALRYHGPIQLPVAPATELHHRGIIWGDAVWCISYGGRSTPSSSPETLKANV